MRILTARKSGKRTAAIICLRNIPNSILIVPTKENVETYPKDIRKRVLCVDDL